MNGDEPACKLFLAKLHEYNNLRLLSFERERERERGVKK